MKRSDSPIRLTINSLSDINSEYLISEMGSSDNNIYYNKIKQEINEMFHYKKLNFKQILEDQLKQQESK